MKKYQLQISLLVFLVLSCFNSATIFGQCDDVTLESLTNPGPFDVATLNESDGIRNGPDYNGATIYYPVNGTPPYASIAIVPGFTALPSSVEQWGPFYASHGIVTIIIGTNSLFDLPELRAIALLDALETLRAENIRGDSPIINQIDADKFAVSGWSMGGGGAQRAAVLDETIKGVVALCPYLNNPSLNHDVPVLILSGQDDTVAPPSQHANIHYNATPNTTTKLLVEIEDGNHSVANTPNGGNGLIGKIALSWVKLNVEENDCYCPLLTDSLIDNPTEASDIRTNLDCETLLGVENNSNTISIYPNPSQELINVKTNNNLTFEIYSALGQKLLEGELTQNNTQIDISILSKGIYYVHIENETFKILKN